MANTLTTEQRNDLQQHGNQPVPVVDPETNTVYFLVAKEVFERFRTVFADDTFDIRETYAAQDAALAKIWDDPALDVYNTYDPLQPRT